MTERAGLRPEAGRRRSTCTPRPGGDVLRIARQVSWLPDRPRTRPFPNRFSGGARPRRRELHARRRPRSQWRGPRRSSTGFPLRVPEAPAEVPFPRKPVATCDGRPCVLTAWCPTDVVDRRMAMTGPGGPSCQRRSRPGERAGRVPTTRRRWCRRRDRRSQGRPAGPGDGRGPVYLSSTPSHQGITAPWTVTRSMYQ